MDRAKKEKVVEELGQIFGSGVVVASHYAGLTVADMQDYEQELEQPMHLFVVKNRFAKLHSKESRESMTDLYPV